MTELSLQAELIELSSNEELILQSKNGYQAFWIQRKILKFYPAPRAASKTFLIAFPSSLLSKREFSVYWLHKTLHQTLSQPNVFIYCTFFSENGGRWVFVFVKKGAVSKKRLEISALEDNTKMDGTSSDGHKDLFLVNLHHKYSLLLRIMYFLRASLWCVHLLLILLDLSAKKNI